MERGRIPESFSGAAVSAFRVQTQLEEEAARREKARESPQSTRGRSGIAET
jgi:hypothetical protein